MSQVLPPPVLMLGLVVAGRRCLVIGTDGECVKRIDRLLPSAAVIDWVSPEPIDISHAGLRPRIAPNIEQEPLDDVAYIAMSTGDAALDQRLARRALALRIPTNCIDKPDYCSVHMPGVIQRGPIQVAISSGGASPATVRLLRDWLETHVPRWFERHASAMAKARAMAKRRFATAPERASWVNKVADKLAAQLGKRP
jgi:siroheme synthase-like protein